MNAAGTPHDAFDSVADFTTFGSRVGALAGNGQAPRPVRWVTQPDQHPVPTPTWPRTAVVATAVGVAACLALELRFNHMGGILQGRYPMLGVLGAWWVAFAVAAWGLLRLPRRAAVVVVLAGAVMFAVAALTAKPQISDDLYRYAWDGSVQAHGIDPYRYPPNDARVAEVRDPWLWPSPKTCASWDKPVNCTRINREMERTIYPPVAQVWFRVLDAVLPAGSRHKGFQVTHGLVGLGLTALLMGVLHNLGRNPAQAVLWAWSPLAVVETVMDAHVDVVALVAAVVALCEDVRSWAEPCSGWASPSSSSPGCSYRPACAANRCGSPPPQGRWSG